MWPSFICSEQSNISIQEEKTVSEERPKDWEIISSFVKKHDSSDPDITGVKLFIGSKVLCILFWNLHSRGERERKGRECKSKTKHTEPSAQEVPWALYIEIDWDWVPGTKEVPSVLYISPDTWHGKREWIRRWEAICPLFPGRKSSWLAGSWLLPCHTVHSV